MRSKKKILDEVYEEGSTTVSIDFKIMKALLEVALDQRKLLKDCRGLLEQIEANTRRGRP